MSKTITSYLAILCVVGWRTSLLTVASWLICLILGFTFDILVLISIAAILSSFILIHRLLQEQETFQEAIDDYQTAQTQVFQAIIKDLDKIDKSSLSATEQTALSNLKHLLRKSANDT